MHTLNTAQLAAQIGKTKDWVYHNWKKLVQDGMPPPIQKGQLIWSTVHIYAWLDRDLTGDLKNTVAAYRAATEAAKTVPEQAPDLIDWDAKIRERLENMN